MSIRPLAASVFALFLVQELAASASDSSAIIAQDQQLNRLISAGDAKAAAPIYLDEFVLTTSRGTSKTKQDVVAEIGSAGLHFEVNETSGVVIHQHGDTAVLTGTLHQRGVYHDKAFDSTLHVTDTWVRTAHGWRLLAGHASVVQ